MYTALAFREQCTLNGLPLSDEQMRLFEALAAGVREWNTKINLISRTDVENIWSKHILASVSFLFTCSLPESSAIVDVGTGGGFPGLPLAILFPKSRFVLIDSIQKKMRVVEDLVRQLALTNVQTRTGRAEEFALMQEHRGRFDYVVARAVAPATELIGWTKPFVRKAATPPPPEEPALGSRPLLPTGVLVLLKGGDLTEELEDARVMAKPRWMRLYPIVIEGADESAPVDKKLVIIQP